jgi:dimethylargininase
MLVALTRAVSPSIVHCELSHLAREPIDVARAAAQHAEYEQALADLGCTVRRIGDAPDMPDAVFVEDTAVVVDELGIITRPGAESRRGETESMADALRAYRSLAVLEAPAMLDGGDVLRVGNRIWIGLSARSNIAAVEQLRALLPQYEIEGVQLRDALHLKTAVTFAGNNTLVLNPAWVDPINGFDVVEVDPAEPFAGNTLRIGETVLCAAAFPATNRRLRDRGFAVREIDASELAKAEGGLTCCSVVFEV